MEPDNILEYKIDIWGDRTNIEHQEKGCFILKYNGEQDHFTIPDYIQDSPVISLDKYAFSEHRELQKIFLAKQLKEIGSHCFYNCRDLRELTLCDGINSIGDGSFKNCDKINKIYLTSSGGGMRCLKGLLSELNQELTVHISFADGEAVLVFPYFLLDYEENTPARVINQVTVGSGVLYRECVTAEGIQYTAYDKNFDAEKHIDVMDSAWKMALYRLLYPYSLSAAAQTVYREYLLENKWKISGKLTDENQHDEIRGLLSVGILSDSDCRRAAEYARSRDRMEILSLILQFRNDNYGNRVENGTSGINGIGNKKYEF